jgi:hypothetical protein
MKLLYDRDVKLLLRDQKFDISAPERWRHGCVKQGLGKETAYQGKPLDSALARPVAALDTGWHRHCHTGPYHGTKNKPLPGCLFEIRFRFLNGRIFFQRGLKNGFQRNGVCAGEDRKARSAYQSGGEEF